MEFQEIQLLEEKLHKLLAYIEQLRAEKAKLSEALAAKEGENQALKAELERLKEEWEKIKAKIQALLERIEEIRVEG